MHLHRHAAEHLPLGETLLQIVKSDHAEGVSIGEIVDAVGEKGFGLLLVVLSLPSALPIPAPGYSTPFGIMIALLAIQMLMGRQEVWMPKRLRTTRIKPRFAEKMIGAASKFLSKIERFIRPRQQWIRSYPGEASLAVVILIMACLMMLPIPFTNTFPAMVIFLIGIALSEEDGLLAIVAFTVGCLAVLLYGGIIYLLITQGPQAIDHLKETIKSLMG